MLFLEIVDVVSNSSLANPFVVRCSTRLGEKSSLIILIEHAKRGITSLGVTNSYPKHMNTHDRMYLNNLTYDKIARVQPGGLAHKYN